MPETSTETAARIGRGKAGVGEQLRRMIDRMLTRHRLAQRIFLGADGKLTPAAAEWFRRLARDNFVEGGGFDIDPRRHAYNEGRRALALDILNSAHLDVGRLGALTRLEREAE